jgi:hypothetical protein
MCVYSAIEITRAFIVLFANQSGGSAMRRSAMLNAGVFVMVLTHIIKFFFPELAIFLL